MLTLDDFVMLGKTVPEPNSDGRVFVCSAGVSPTMRSLVRIYPLGRYGAPARWSTSTVRLERNSKDSRVESFRLAGDRSPDQHHRINLSSFTVTGTVGAAARADILGPYLAESIDEANAPHRRASLALLHPDQMELEFEHNPASPDSPQLSLFALPGDEPQGARRFPYIPRLRFRDGAGRHRLMLRDWGVYELMRKHNNLTAMTESDRQQYLGEALHPSCSLLIGNFNQHRTSWLVISVLRGLRSAPSLFDEVEGAA